MADDKNLETNSQKTTSASRSKRSSSSRSQTAGSEIDLAMAESRADGEGFNHPHARTETTTDLGALTREAGSQSSSTATSRLGNLSREEVVNNFKDYAKEYAGKARETAETVRKQAGDFAKRFEDVPAKGREVFERVDTTTRANPWLSIAVTGAGALALGFLAGKLFARASEAVGEAGYDFDQAMDE